MAEETVLLVEDEEAQRAGLSDFLTELGYSVIEAADAESAVSELDRRLPDLVLTDQRMPGGGGLQVLKRTGELDPDLPVVVMTAFGSIGDAVEAMRLGAADYLTKPIDLDELDLVLSRALKHRRILRENLELKEELSRLKGFSEIIYKSRKMAELLDTVALAAGSKASVLITGESGTGKELVARAIHQGGPRKDQPLVAVNCSAIPESLMDSELFGHQKGAFTGAKDLHRGRFERADGGILFLDEVADLPATVQVKLLRVLQEQEVERLGGEKPIKVDVRILAATSQDLEGRVKSGQFRQDLYYRLRVIAIHIPPLRERAEDIPPLAAFFLTKYNRDNNRRIKGFTRGAVNAMKVYDWPGNVRELENMVESAVVLCRGELIAAEDLSISPGSETGSGAEDGPPGLELAALEKWAIQKALERADGNKTATARLLGMHRNTLQRKLDALDL